VTFVPIILFGPNDVIYFNDVLFAIVDVDDACLEALVFGHWWKGLGKCQQV